MQMPDPKKGVRQPPCCQVRPWQANLVRVIWEPGHRERMKLNYFKTFYVKWAEMFQQLSD